MNDYRIIDGARRYHVSERCIHGLPTTMRCDACYATEHLVCTTEWGGGEFNVRRTMTTLHRGCSLDPATKASA
jgi:hypothetical protein